MNPFNSNLLFWLLDKAAQTADEMANLLRLVTPERVKTGKAIDLRNRAYTHLKEAVDEIWDYGQLVFRNNEKRAAGYFSSHLKRLRRKSARKKDEEEAVTS